MSGRKQTWRGLKNKRAASRVKGGAASQQRRHRRCQQAAARATNAWSVQLNVHYRDNNDAFIGTNRHTWAAIGFLYKYIYKHYCDYH